MEDLPVERRNKSRIGVMFIAMAVMILPIVASSPTGGAGWFGLFLFALLGAAGVGLLFRAPFARVMAGLMFLAVGLLSPFSLLGALERASRWGLGGLGWFLSVANAVGSTLLLVWLCYRAIKVLIGTTHRASVLTARITGGVLAVIAASHLWTANEMSSGWGGAWSFNISPSGTQLVGFVGWPIWHLLLLVPSLLLLAGPRRTLEHAVTGVLALFAGLVLLVLITAARTDIITLDLFTLMLGIALLPVYLTWWLRDALRDLPSSEPVAA